MIIFGKENVLEYENFPILLADLASIRVSVFVVVHWMEATLSASQLDSHWPEEYQRAILLTWFNFNPIMDT